MRTSMISNVGSSVGFAVAILLVAAAPADADSNEVTFGSFDRVLRSPSANAVTADSLGGVTLTYGRQLELDVIHDALPRLTLWVTGGFTGGSVDGTMFQTLQTEVAMLGFAAGGRAAYALHRLVGVSARLDVGTARNELTIHGHGHTVSDASWGGIGTAAVGLDLHTAAHRRFSLGLRLELGYVTATAVALSPREAADDSKIELDAMQASIGHLDLGGRYLAFSVLSQF